MSVEDPATFCERIDVRGTDVVHTVAAEFRPQVIYADENEILGSSACRLEECEESEELDDIFHGRRITLCDLSLQPLAPRRNPAPARRYIAGSAR